MSGKAVKKNKQRDHYTLLSYSTAKKTARRIDQQLKLVRSPKALHIYARLFFINSMALAISIATWFRCFDRQ